jgi:glycosyltransferase involved in cell wall biosynthesis
MRVALVQDWFVVNGGAEKVFREFVNLYPQADVFALVDFLNDRDRADILDGKPVKTTWLQNLPSAKKTFRNFLVLFPHAIRSLDLSSYDLIISSSYAVAKGIRKRNGQTHICYCHSPIRYAWDLRESYLSRLGPFKKTLAGWMLDHVAKWDLKTNATVDHFIANSRNVAERIHRTYGRESTVIYPPVDTVAFAPEHHKNDYYFTSLRVVPYKRLDLIVDAFRKLPKHKLVVAGDGPALAKIKANAPSNVSFVGFVDKPALVDYMQKAKAFILAAEEDFGITSLEAQSCLTPVIALRKGGYLETVVDGKTGVFFNEQTVESLVDAIHRFEKRDVPFDAMDFEKNVKGFSPDRFRSEMQQFINSHAAI